MHPDHHHSPSGDVAGNNRSGRHDSAGADACPLRDSGGCPAPHLFLNHDQGAGSVLNALSQRKGVPYR